MIGYQLQTRSGKPRAPKMSNKEVVGTLGLQREAVLWDVPVAIGPWNQLDDAGRHRVVDRRVSDLQLKFYEASERLYRSLMRQ